MPRYADADAFIKMLRSGQRPDRTALAVMPFESLKQLNDTDATALFVYLKGLPGG